MISESRAQRVIVNMLYYEAMTTLKDISRSHGFEIMEIMDLRTFVLNQTGKRVSERNTLVQMQKPSTILESVLLGDSLPLLLPLRIILTEVSASVCVFSIPFWEVARDSESSDAHHCMDLLYRETVAELTTALSRVDSENSTILTERESFGRSCWWNTKQHGQPSVISIGSILYSPCIPPR